MKDVIIESVTVMELLKDGRIRVIEDRVNRACEEERRSDNAGKTNAAS